MERRTRVLLAEDEAITALSIRAELERTGHEVCAYISAGEDVADAFDRSAPDIVLMDIGLAGSMDGIEAAARIRERSDVPLIFMTGYGDGPMRERARALLPREYLIKPIRMGELIRTIDLASATLS
jgi:two-component system, response regulator PdtaR